MYEKNRDDQVHKCAGFNFFVNKGTENEWPIGKL